MRLGLRNFQYIGGLWGPAAAGPAAVSRGYEFNGSTYVRFTGGGVTLAHQAYTISAWLRPSIPGNTGVTVRSDGGPMGSWSHSLKQSGSVWQNYTYGGSGGTTVNSITAPIVGTWQHVTASATANGLQKIYVNGQPEGSYPVSSLWAGGNDYWLAAAFPGGNTPFTGQMCEYAIWSSQLSDAEVEQLATGQRGLPPTIQPGTLIVYIPMQDTAEGVTVPGNYDETQGVTQTRTGAPIGRNVTLPSNTPLVRVSEDFESYAAGAVGDGSGLTGGTEWSGAPVVFDWVPTTSSEDFESYGEGAVGDGSSLTAGANWNGAPVVTSY